MKRIYSIRHILPLAVLTVVAGFSARAAAPATQVIGNNSEIGKNVVIKTLDLATPSDSALSIRYMPMPTESPFCTAADFVLPFESRVAPQGLLPQGVPVPVMASELNLPKTLPTFYYMPLYDQAWTTARDFSLCSFDPNTGTIGRLAGADAFYGADFGIAAGNTLYTSLPLTNGCTYRCTVDLTTYEVTSQVYNVAKLQVLSSAYDKATGTIYACCLNSENTAFHLTTFDPATDSMTEPIISFGVEGMSAMGFTRTGRLVGISRTGKLSYIDKETGELTPIANYDLPTSYNCSGCCDLTRNIFYYAYFGGVGDSRLIAFDLSSGAAQVLCTVPRSIEMQGLWIPFAPFDDGMPGEPTGYAVDFTDDSLQGTVSFTMPATTYGGDTPADGDEIDYELLFDDVVRYTGKAGYGRHIEVPVSVDRRGLYTIALKVSNEAGYGETLSEMLYIGYDDVTDIAAVDMQMSDTQFSLEWNQVVAVHGGYINPDHIRYDVVRYPDATTVATGLTDASLIVPVAADLPDGTYSFGVTAHYYDPVAGAMAVKPEVRSGVRVKGDYKVPFTYSLTNALEASQIFTVENVNRDEETWQFSTQGAVIQYNQYNTSNGMDDWLFSMPIHLDAGIIYNLMTSVSVGNGNYAESIEIKAGTSTRSGAMTVDVLPISTVNLAKQLTGSFYVDTPGTYYVGFHACSTPDTYYLLVSQMSMTAAGTTAAPGAVTALTLEAVYGYDLEQTQIHFVAPTATAAGQPLQSIERIDILRNGEVVHTIDNPVPGVAVDYLDTISKRGIQEYTVVAYNESGAGMSAAGSVFVGYGAPLSVEVMNSAIVSDDDNTVRLWWDPVTRDVNGRTIDRTMWYQPNVIFPNSGQSTAGNGIYSAPGFTHANVHKKYGELNPNYDVDVNEQFFVQYYMSNFFYEGKGLWEGPTHAGAGHTFTSYVPVGKAYDLPFKESFADGVSGHVFNLVDYGTQGDYYISANSTAPTASPYDGDGGMLEFRPQALNDVATLFSGRINLRDAVIPRLTYYFYAVPGSRDEIDVIVGNSSTDMRVLSTVKVGEPEAAGWTKVITDLGKFRGQVVQFGVRSRAVSGTSYVLIDDIEVVDPEENNLALGELQAPKTARANRAMTVSAVVTNNGHYDMSGYTASFYVDGVLVEKRECDALAQGKSATVAFSYTPSVIHTEGVRLRIDIAADDDSDPADNTTGDVLTMVTMPAWPVVEDLEAATGDTGVTLSWSRPTGIGDVAEDVEDNVETYTAFSTGLQSSELGEDDYMGNWTVVDADGQPTTHIANRDFVNNRLSGDYSTPKAWMVFNLEKADVASAYAAGLTPRSGDQCFICPAAEPFDDTHGNDDWLISPLLSGNAQTVTFYAKSISTAYGRERFEVLYSAAGNAVEDFVKITATTVDDSWNLQSVDLPEGARYFAIRCTSYDVWALMVDDISYEAGADESLQLTGYNVYHNRQLVSPEPVEECGYIDAGVVDGVHDYHVTAIYNMGESALSNTVTVDFTKSGIDSVSLDGMTVAVKDCVIIVTGADGRAIAVYTTDGMAYAHAVGSAVTRIPVAPAVYLVKIGDKVIKLAAR